MGYTHSKPIRFPIFSHWTIRDRAKFMRTPGRVFRIYRVEKKSLPRLFFPEKKYLPHLFLCKKKSRPPFFLKNHVFSWIPFLAKNTHFSGKFWIETHIILVLLVTWTKNLDYMISRVWDLETSWKKGANIFQVFLDFDWLNCGIIWKQYEIT